MSTGDPCRAREGTEGSICDALSQAAGDAALLLAGSATEGLAVQRGYPGNQHAGTHPGGRLGSVREVPRRTHLQAAWNERHVLLSAAREVRPHHVRVRSAKREADAS